MTLLQQVANELKAVRGLPFWDCGRAAGLQWLQFGLKHEVTSEHGVAKLVGDVALHIQCSWRLRSAAEIIVASGDRYFPKGDPNADDEGFDWDVPGANRCDERMHDFVVGHCPLIVESVGVQDNGAFSLALGRGFFFDVFPDHSLDGEHWRLFRPAKSGPHTVFEGGRIVVE